MKKILLLTALAACSPAARRNIDRGTLIMSTAALACDWAQTRSAAADGWVDFYEANPVMGPAPSARVVDAYFLGAAALNIVIWNVLPAGWRSALPVVVTGFQARSIRNNAPNTGWCI